LIILRLDEYIGFLFEALHVFLLGLLSALHSERPAYGCHDLLLLVLPNGLRFAVIEPYNLIAILESDWVGILAGFDRGNRGFHFRPDFIAFELADLSVLSPGCPVWRRILLHSVNEIAAGSQFGNEPFSALFYVSRGLTFQRHEYL